MKVSDKEVVNVSALEPFKRYQYLIKKIADFEEVWTIKDEKNEYALSDIDNHTMISLWSAEEFIKSNLSGSWKNCTPVKLDLKTLSEELLLAISENHYLINVFPVNEKSGFVVSVEEFVRDLNEELEQYC